MASRLSAAKATEVMINTALSRMKEVDSKDKSAILEEFKELVEINDDFKYKHEVLYLKYLRNNTSN